MGVTLAESQNKKATFLREVVRSLGLPNVEVWAGRAEVLVPDRRFHTVTLRAVDNMVAALAAAEPLAERQIVLLTTGVPELPSGFTAEPPISIPGTDSGIVLRAVRG
jgi:16S rRNA (guanine527-N7)-methyltransferase